jgi:hypothetical protein
VSVVLSAHSAVCLILAASREPAKQVSEPVAKKIEIPEKQDKQVDKLA